MKLNNVDKVLKIFMTQIQKAPIAQIPISISTTLTCLFATDFNPHNAITSYNHGPQRKKKHYKSTTILDQASMDQSSSEDLSNGLDD